MSIFFGRSLIATIILLFVLQAPSFAQVDADNKIALADTNQAGNILLYKMEGWQFSFQRPETITDGKNLSATIPGSIDDMRELKKDPEWNNYGWFELEINADSTLAGVPWVLTYGNPEPVRIWLNGKLMLKAGNPSQYASEEKLSLFYNPIFKGLILREGINHILIEYSEHTLPKNFKPYFQSEHGIWVVLYAQNDDTLRRQRAVIFGGVCMLLLLLVVIHSYLAYLFKGEYHLFVALTTIFMLFHAFTTLSDTIINWTYSYVYFFEYSNAISFMFVVYFFLISIRKIYELEIPWRTLTSILIVSVISGVISVNFYKPFINILHPLLVLGTFIYGGWSLYQAKKQRDSNIRIIAFGLLITIGGAILYVIPYVAFGSPSITLFLIAVLMAYTGVPIALTFNVAANYASLIKTLETKVQERTEDLEAANEYQKRFFANISHEFRTPLTISEGLINKVIRKEDLNQVSTKSDLSVVKRNMNRLHDMVDQIIDLTKSEKNHLALHQGYYKADNLAAISVESFRSLAEYHGHDFDFYPGAGASVLHVDRNKMEVVINNLISNAIKFTPDGGKIEIKTRIDSEIFVLTVSDSGPGIPEGKEEVIFERFHRLSRSEEEYVEGMGVGLELSQTLANLHGGEIEALPQVDEGAVFKLTLPVVDVDENALTSLLEPEEENLLYLQESKQELASKEKFSILLVEDNEDMMNYIADILSELGDVVRAGNGKEAMNMLSNYTPDIIITDLMMPVMGGQKLIENLFDSKKWSNIPVIVLTAKALEDDKLHLLRIGVVDYITKPFQPEQLLLKTRNLLTYYNRRKRLKIDLSMEEAPVKEERLSEKAAAFVMRNLADSNISVESIADEFSQSRSSLYRNIQLETGMTPAEFIREVRLTAARKIVAENKNLRLEELANSVGYKSATSFRKKYEERFGVHPLGS